MKTRILYISYDGMLEPLGQSQVLAYLERLTTTADISLISFEKPEDWANGDARAALTRRIAAAGIRWTPLRYHRTPSAPATAYDIAAGTAAAIAIALRRRIGIVHARSYVAGLMALGVKRATGAKLLFDMRGFWADERVDAGLWPAGGRLYKSAKRLERNLLLAADHVVTLTNASVREMARFPYLAGRVPPMTVISTCTDLGRFRPDGPASSRPFVLGHVGAVGTWYLFDELLATFKLLTEFEPDARLAIVNRGEHEFIDARLRAMAVDRDRVTLGSADHRDVPAAMRAFSAGSAIIKPVYSKIASAPTKLGEYLGCGIPCLGNVGVGDMEALLEGERVGVALPGFTRDELAAGVHRLVALTRQEGVADRCIRAARAHFSLDDGAESYRAIYETLNADGAPDRR